MSGATPAIPAVPPPRDPRPAEAESRPRQVGQLALRLAAATELDVVASVLTGDVGPALEAVAVSLTVLVAPTVLELVAVTGDTPGVTRRGTRFPLGTHDPITEAARTRRPVVVQGRAAVLTAYPDLWAGEDGTERSVAAVPLLAGGECLGVVGLAFDRESVDEADLCFLSTAAAVAAQALARVSAHRAEQDRYAQMAFLLAATTELAAGLHYQQTLQRLADLVVPDVANWCAIDVLDDGALHPFAVAHADPEKVELARRMRQAYPPDPHAPTGAHVVARTGVAELYEDVDPALLEAAAHDAEHLRLVRDLDLRSAILVPLVAGDRTLGVLTLVRTGDARRYGRPDLAFARELAARAAVAIDNAQVHSETVEASLQLQRAVLPESLAGTAGWQVAVDYRPAGRTAVGGDFYDAVPLPDGRLAVFVGDVMGRGVAAAAAMAQVRSALRAYLALDPAPGVVVERLSVMFEALDLPQLVTVLYAVLDRSAGTAELVSAGHLPPLAVRPDGQVDVLDVRASPPLGAGHHRREPVVAALAAGDTLLLFTDGLIERRGEDLDTGLARLHHAARCLRGDVTDSLLARLADGLREAGHDDDVTLLAVRARAAVAAPL